MMTVIRLKNNKEINALITKVQLIMFKKTPFRECH